MARLGYMTGTVSFSPAGENDWVQAALNRPLTTGDRLWTDAGARAELQVGGAMIRMSANTAVSVLNLDDRIAQLQLTQGTLNVRVRRLEPGQVFEVATPNLAFTLAAARCVPHRGRSRRQATTIIVRKGQGEAYGEGAAYVIDSRQPYRFTGTGLRDYEYVDGRASTSSTAGPPSATAATTPPAPHAMCRATWSATQDLDANGTWRVDAEYGNVWFPTRVRSDWAPYRDGHWTWVDPWGWTWMDDAPWGYAVSHYGRWAHLRGHLGLGAGSGAHAARYYAPALVAFVGGTTSRSPLERQRRWHRLVPAGAARSLSPVVYREPRYFESVNRSNTVVNNTVINNTYNNVNVTNVVYANRQVPGAVVAVPTTTFVQSQPVARSVVALPQTMAQAHPWRSPPSSRRRSKACVAPPRAATSRRRACSSVRSLRTAHRRRPAQDSPHSSRNSRRSPDARSTTAHASRWRPPRRRLPSLP